MRIWIYFLAFAELSTDSINKFRWSSMKIEKIFSEQSEFCCRVPAKNSITDSKICRKAQASNNLISRIDTMYIMIEVYLSDHFTWTEFQSRLLLIRWSSVDTRGTAIEYMESAKWMHSSVRNYKRLFSRNSVCQLFDRFILRWLSPVYLRQ